MMMQMLMRKTKWYLPIISLFGVLFFLGLIYGKSLQAGQPTTYKYPLLAKRIQIDNPNETRLNFVRLRNDLKDYTNNVAGGVKPSDISLYFEYLPTGVEININEKSQVTAASLMKLPLVMTLYKSAQDGQINLDDKVKLKKEWLDPGYGTLYKMGEGYELSLRDAAKIALTESDNTANNMIKEAELPFASDGKGVINYIDLEAELSPDGQRVLVGSRAYSSVLKCLYLSCYNSKQDSEQILEFLTESKFSDRLTKYVPSDMKVAHKIGTYITINQNDCGIFYLPGNNYILCIMVEGEDPVASEVIADLSRIVYSHLTSGSSLEDGN